MSNTLKRVTASEATTEQIADYIEFNGIDLTTQTRRDRDHLLAIIASAKLADPIVVRPAEALAPQVSMAGEEYLRQEFDLENERWIRVQIGLDEKSKSKKRSIVPLIYHTDSVWVPRGVDVVLRERFVRVLKDAKATTVSQDNLDGKFSDAQIIEVFPYPHQVLQILGRCADGEPKGLPEDVRLIR